MLCRHPNLVSFLGISSTELGQMHLVFELMEAGSLASLLVSDKGLEWGLRQQFALELARGVQHLHGLGMIHRDLKSDNRLVSVGMHAKVRSEVHLAAPVVSPRRTFRNVLRFSNHRSASSLQVGDFGQGRLTETITAATPVELSARRNRASSLATQARSVASLTAEAVPSSDVVTPNWSAPELLQNAEYDRAIDIYSFGIMMWELVSRKLPWDGIIGTDLESFKAALLDAIRSGRCPPTDGEGFECAETCLVLMRAGWSTAPADCPNFDFIVTSLG